MNEFDEEEFSQFMEMAEKFGCKKLLERFFKHREYRQIPEKINGHLVRPISYSDNYLVSDNGEVFSLNNNQIKTCYQALLYQKNRKKERTGESYKIVNLSNEGKTKTFAVHRLVAEAFLPNPEGLRCVNHKDGNKHNNNVENLEWCTNSQNTRHAYATGLINPYREGKVCKVCGEKIGDNNKSGLCQICKSKGLVC